MPTARRSLKEVFLDALAVSPEARAAWLEGECAGDPHLRRQVELMLDAHDCPQCLIDRVAPPAGPASEGLAVKPGTVIGPYKLMEQIGEGGMGMVFVAEQQHPVRRKVALKIVKPGLDSAQVVARFEAERQALAMMDHQNIARVHDAGTTPDGRPYFVMELIHGVPITDYCDANKLTPRQRLELFVPVCHALQHAHQKGVIHRDVKPSNVLVTMYDDKPVPKVIDFGVAKAIEQRLTDRTLYTQFGALVGTFEYMSPEQAEMNAFGVDTRSDVYSLGVLLYELLTGTTPLERARLREAAFGEIVRLIKEEEPPRPSVRLSTSGALAKVAAARQTDSARLSRLVRGELDWIVMRCLEKDRTRRYETANGLARDVERYLHDEPIEARPPTFGYRFGKLARRHRRALAPAALLGVVLLAAVGTVAGSIGWQVRDREARRTKLASELDVILEEVVSLESAQKWSEAVAAARRAEALVTGAGGDAALEWRIHQVLGDLKLVERLEVIRLARDRPNKTESYHAWADRAYAAAVRHAGVDLDQLSPDVVCERLRGRAGVRVALATALDDWAYCRTKQQDAAGSQVVRAVAQRLDPDPWRDQLREAMARKDAQMIDALAASPDLTRQPPATLFLLSVALYLVEKPERGLAVLRKASGQYPSDFWLTYSLGWRLRELGPDFRDEATGYCRTAVALRPHSSWAWLSLGGALQAQENWDAALVVYRRIQVLEPTSVWAYLDAGRMLDRLERRDEALASYWKALGLEPKFGPARQHFLRAVRHQADRDTTFAFFRTVIEADPKNALAHNAIGHALWWQGKREESLAYFERAVALDPTYPDFHHSLANNLRRFERVDEALASFEKAMALGLRDDWMHFEYGAVLRQKGRLADAIRNWKTSVDMNPNRIESRRALSWHLATAADPQLRDPAAAVTHAWKTVAIDPDTPQHWSNLGVAQWRAGDLRDAVGTLEQADGRYPDGDNYHRFFLAMAYWQTGEPVKACAAYQQGVRWAEKNRPASEELRRFRAEAETVLKVEKK